MENSSEVKKKIQISTKEMDMSEKSLEVPVPKVRQVLPGNEGGYKVKVPPGTTERSKKLIEQAKKRKSKTVFDRLGESSVSSTTSEITMSTSISSPANKEKNPSVFSRLGEKTSMVSSTSSIEECEIGSSDQLQYAGIFKGSTQKKSSSSTMRADEQEESEVNKISKGGSVKKRLGLSNSEESSQQYRPLFKKRRLLGEAEDAGPILKIPKNFSTIKPRIITNVNSEADKIDKAITKASKTKTFTLKQRIGAALDTSPFKKVRFGRTTHRLIPGTPDSQSSVNYLKNYPKLTMTIDNTERLENNKASSGVKMGSLNSDSVPDKVGIKARIGYQQLLKKSSAFTKKSSVKDRLG